ncbi:MAG: N-formylglutamate amidohydrolase [Alphaproteobacteria bacterium]|nr:N-formylglutamate amidohydrolase [Alphaproteobacteria bacterium]
MSNAGPLIGEGDPPPFEMVDAEGEAPVLLLCDHAGQAVPRALGGLGLPPEVFQRHVAWDIGAALVTRGLARRLGGPAVLGCYSRLVIDLNRQPGDPTSIPCCSDGVEIPGNQNLGDSEAERRIADFFWPYHHTVTGAIARLWRHGAVPPALIAVHSFTPVMNGFKRPWHVGVLWNRDPRMAVPVIEGLNRLGDWVVGDNEPYSGRDIAFSIDRHAGAAGLPHVAFEIRQDLIADPAGAERWADILAGVLAPILARPGLHTVVQY